ASVISSVEMTSFNLRLYVNQRHRFRYDGDHLWASTGPDMLFHAQIHDLLVERPRSRNRGRGTALLAGLERLVRKHGIKWIGGGISGIDDMTRVEAFYRHRGYSVIRGIPDGPFEWQLLKQL